MDVSVVIPTYNEKDNIARLVKEILKRINAEIVIVDDNSPDGTGAIADKLAGAHKNIRVIHRAGRRGLGSAIVEGLESARGDIVGVMDADFSHPPEALNNIMDEFGKGADIVLGSRYVKGGRIEKWPLKRKLASRVAVMLAKPVANVKDPVTGFFFLKKSVFDSINIRSVNTNSWKVSLEILARARYGKLAEVPYTFVNRKRGNSKISAAEYKTYLQQICGLLVFKFRRKIKYGL